MLPFRPTSEGLDTVHPTGPHFVDGHEFRRDIEMHHYSLQIQCSTAQSPPRSRRPDESPGRIKNVGMIRGSRWRWVHPESTQLASEGRPGATASDAARVICNWASTAPATVVTSSRSRLVSGARSTSSGRGRRARQMVGHIHPDGERLRRRQINAHRRRRSGPAGPCRRARSRRWR